MILKFIETLQFRLIFKILLLNGPAHFVLDDSAAPIVYRFSPTSRASLEEKRVSVQKLLTIFCDFFYLCGGSLALMILYIYFVLKDGKDFGNWERTEVGKLSSVKYVSCGTSAYTDFCL